MTGVGIYPQGYFGGRGWQKQWAQSLERTIESIFGILRYSRRSSVTRGSSGGCDHETLMLELVKIISPEQKRDQSSQSIGRGIKHPNTTQWRGGPISHTSMLVKFCNDQTQLRPRSWKGGSYRQSALIPTCDALDSIIHQSYTQTCMIKIRDSREDITTQLYK